MGKSSGRPGCGTRRRIADRTERGRRRGSGGGAAWCVLAVSGALLLNGCSGDDEPRSVTLDRPDTSAPVTLGQVESLRDPVAGELTRAGDVATGPRQQAVAQAWFSYLEEVVRMLSTPDASTFRLRELAVGGGVDGPQAYAERVVEGGLRLSGGMVATLQEVTVDGDRATVRGCVHSSMVEVDSVGEPVGELVPWLRASNSLVRAGDSWLVDHHRLERSEKCV